MATTALPISLVNEFLSLQEAVTKRKLFQCHGTTKKNEQCRRMIGADAKEQLSTHITKVIKFFEEGCGDIKTSLYEASLLVMCSCTQNHQHQAARKYKIWMDKLSLDNGDIEPIPPFSGTSKSKDVGSTISSSDEQRVESQMTAAPRTFDQPSSPPCQQSSDLEFEDSGYQSGNEEDSAKNSTAPSLPTVRADHSSDSSTSSEIGVPGPETPKRASVESRTDSAVSLSYDTLCGNQFEPSAPHKVAPVSPLADKAGKGQRVTRDAQPSRPAATPIQLQSITTTTDSSPPSNQPTPRRFAVYKDPSKYLADYIKQPLGSTDLKEGYVYVFQVDGCSLNKIGSVKKRANKNTLDASLEQRIAEHKSCGWKALTVLKIRVPHAGRVEKIIHHHFLAGRRIEKDLCKGANGVSCRHKKHQEWFEVPLEVIYRVVQAWCGWINTNPYIEIRGAPCLSQEWMQNLGTVQVTAVGDYWLAWLSRHMAGPREADGKNDPFKATGTIESTKDQCDGETMHAPKAIGFPDAGLVLRLKQSKTWPRKIQSAIGEKE